MYTCGTCFRRFPSGWRARDRHCDSTGHDRPALECDFCDEYFDFTDEREEHGQEVHLYCHGCERQTSTENGMSEVSYAQHTADIELLLGQHPT